MRSLFSLAIFCLAGGFAPIAAADAPVAGDARVMVKLVRPTKVGNRFNEVTTARYEQMVRTREDKGIVESETEKSSVYLDVDQEVLAVTPKGSPKSYRLEVKEFTRTTPKGREVLFKPGTVIIGKATANGSSFRLNGESEELDDAKQGILADLFGMSDKDDAVTMDDLYGTTRPIAMGETRPIDQNIALQWFRNPGDPRLIVGVSGESRLVKISDVNGMKCYTFGHTTSVRSRSNVQWQRMGQSPESHYLSAMLIHLPVDNTTMERGYTSMKRNRYISPANDGPPDRRNEVIVESTYDTAIKPLPPAPPKPEAEEIENPAPDPQPNARRQKPDELAKEPAGRNPDNQANDDEAPDYVEPMDEEGE